MYSNIVATTTTKQHRSLRKLLAILCTHIHTNGHTTHTTNVRLSDMSTHLILTDRINTIKTKRSLTPLNSYHTHSFFSF